MATYFHRAASFNAIKMDKQQNRGNSSEGISLNLLQFSVLYGEALKRSA